jgi:hypothetical protein
MSTELETIVAKFVSQDFCCFHNETRCYLAKPTLDRMRELVGVPHRADMARPELKGVQKT